MPLQFTSIGIIGKGRLGRSLAAAVRAHPSYRLHSHVPGRAFQPKSLERGGGPEVLIIAVKDDVIAQVAEESTKATLPNLRILAHLSGAMASELLPELKGVARLTLHPMQTFPRPNASLFNGITFMGSSSSRIALQWAHRFTTDIGGHGFFTLSSEEVPLYHALVVLAANSITILGGAVEDLSELLGKKPSMMKKALAPLMRQSLENVLIHDALDVLTGPFSRKDEKTIARHRKALRSHDPTLLALYDAVRALAKAQVGE